MSDAHQRAAQYALEKLQCHDEYQSRFIRATVRGLLTNIRGASNTPPDCALRLMQDFV